jgi:RNA polymerase sigma-70 factor (ECF subfamily)
MRNVPKVEDRQTPAEKPAPVQANTEAERQLVRQAQAGDSSAYEELVRIHHHRILAVVGGILRGGEDVEDIAQQALVKAYLSLKRFDQRSGFGTWLYKIAVNECWDYFRKKKVRRLVYESDLSEDQLRQMEATPDSRGGGIKSGSAIGRHVEQSDLLNRLLDEIDEKDRTMLVMKEVGGFTVEEIGDVLSLNVNTVKVRLFRARAKLVETYRRRLKGHTSVRSSSKS